MQDDETYVKVDFQQLNGQKFYVSKIRGNVPKKFKYVLQDKFAKKYMIWQGICSCGMKSRSFVTSSTMNAQLYIKECLERRVLPLIRSHSTPVKFWPDLASCHYAKDTITWYNVNNVDFISKELNPPNCPQIRPIEIFWAIMKRKLKKKGGSAKEIGKMLQKWNQIASTVSSDTVKKLMGSIPKKVTEFLKSDD